jgi:hypothetical protein
LQSHRIAQTPTTRLLLPVQTNLEVGRRAADLSAVDPNAVARSAHAVDLTTLGDGRRPSSAPSLRMLTPPFFFSSSWHHQRMMQLRREQ